MFSVMHDVACLADPTGNTYFYINAVRNPNPSDSYLQVMVTTGGTTLKDDLLRLNDTVRVLVGTLGRFLDLVGKGVAYLSECPVFVADEADKLLSSEFASVMKQVLAFLPSDRQVMLFSATFPLIVKDFKVRYYYL